ncbi:hypothetical protein R6Q59_011151 [Mikania micrantha]
MTYVPQYRLITVEFLSTFRYRPQAPDFQPQPGQPQQAEVSFRLCGAAYHLSLAEFGSVLGLYTEEETHMPIYTTAIHTADDAVVSAWWPRIGDDAFVRSARVTRIRDPLIRYLHRCIASSVTGRGMSQEWCTSQDLFFLYCILSGRSCRACVSRRTSHGSGFDFRSRGGSFGSRGQMTSITETRTLCLSSHNRSRSRSHSSHPHHMARGSRIMMCHISILSAYTERCGFRLVSRLCSRVLLIRRRSSSSSRHTSTAAARAHAAAVADPAAG